ncbi:11875_t:CDS:2, partial [Funneliformis mosseae]
LRKLSYIEDKILKFEKDAKDWVRTFCQPTIGQMNSAATILELYRKKD